MTIAVDSNWTSVTLLAHFNGADGATTFTEATGKTLTANGNAQLDTAQTRFGTASLLLDGASDFVSVPDDAGFNLGSGDFTIEAWIRSNTLTGNHEVLSKRADSVDVASFLIHQSGSALTFYATSDGVTWDIANGVTIGTIAANTWYHVAIARKGNVWRTYLHGIQGGAFTNAAALHNDTTNLCIGANADGSNSFSGWIDEVRITKGVARYASSVTFLVPQSAGYEAAPATSDALDPQWPSVVLLSHMDGDNAGTLFRDTSTGKTITAVGNAQTSTAQSKFGGKSLLLDGSGDWLTSTDADYNLANNDFTIEFWAYFVAGGHGSAYSRLIQIGPNSTAGGLYIITDNLTNPTAIFVQAYNGTGYVNLTNPGATLSNAAWHHIAYTRKGAVNTLWVDGVQYATLDVSATFNRTELYIGGSDAAEAFNGHIDEVRITNGVARYTGAFTPSTTAFPDNNRGTATSATLGSSGSAPFAHPSLSQMTAAGYGPPGAVVTFQPMSAQAGAPGAAPALRPLSATGVAVFNTEGRGSFLPLEVAGTSIGGGSAHTLYSDFEPMSATGAGSAGSVATGSVTFAELNAAGYTPVKVAVSFEAMRGAATGNTGTVARAAVSFKPITDSAAAYSGSLSAGSPALAALRATAYGAERNTAYAAVSFQKARAAAAALNGTVARAATSFEELRASGQALHVVVANGAVTFLPLAGRAISVPVLTDTRRTWVVNAGSEAMSEYQNYGFDSYAEFAGHHYGAGDGGLVRLDGADDRGANIAWSFRTGLLDGKDAMLKRLEEVVLAIRFDGPLRVRIWTDDNSFYDYHVANYRPDVVHQVRARLGKGARSRFYRVEVSGVGNTAAELHSMQLPMIPLQRRIG